MTITGTAESIEKATQLIEDVIGNRAGASDDDRSMGSKMTAYFVRGRCRS